MWSTSAKRKGRVDAETEESEGGGPEKRARAESGAPDRANKRPSEEPAAESPVKRARRVAQEERRKWMRWDAAADLGLGAAVYRGASFAKLEERFEQQHAAYKSRLFAPEKFRSYVDPKFAENSFDGDGRYASMRNDLDGFPAAWLPTPVQRIIHDQAFMAEGPLIYGDEWRVNKKVILERNKWKSVIAILAVLTPRKFGKTYGVFFHHALLFSRGPA